MPVYKGNGARYWFVTSNIHYRGAVPRCRYYESTTVVPVDVTARGVTRTVYFVCRPEDAIQLAVDMEDWLKDPFPGSEGWANFETAFGLQRPLTPIAHEEFWWALLHYPDEGGVLFTLEESVAAMLLNSISPHRD